MIRAIFPGSFDPVTLGHEDIIRRGAALFDHLVVAVLHNPGKQGLFAVQERVGMLKCVCSGMPRVSVLSFEGLLADFARRQDARIVLRGVRGAMDLEHESALAQANGLLLPGLETLLLPASPGLAGTSSSLVREIAAFGGDVAPFVSPCVAEALRAHFHQAR